MNVILSVLLISATVSSTYQETIKEEYTRKLRNGDFQILRAWNETHLQELTDDGGEIIAVIDEFGDKIISHIQKLIMRNGLDPVELPSESLKLIPWGNMALSDGWLQNLSTLSRNTDIKVIYRSSRRSLELQVPVKFDALKFTYDYNTHVFPLSISGGVEGRLNDVKINIILSFDFKGFKAHLDDFDIRNSGSISIRFTGHGLIDWITNAMTSVVTLFLKPVILNIVDWLLKDSLDSIVDFVNKAIECARHSNQC
ncbi:uncharacterized protein [Leptinotarsa decemlineata]|uniref:uncharacterized protein n=1 Tax=Leptinotarsa decemlineata TaxID=7539 RepID=UPI003D30CE77